MTIIADRALVIGEYAVEITVVRWHNYQMHLTVMLLKKQWMDFENNHNNLNTFPLAAISQSSTKRNHFTRKKADCYASGRVIYGW